jgi:hypothetical protein
MIPESCGFSDKIMLKIKDLERLPIALETMALQARHSRPKRGRGSPRRVCNRDEPC